jgi:hypothetical protein
VTSSVSGIRGAARRPAADGQVCSVNWAVACPMVTAVVRCDPVVRGPDVAPVWPSGPELGRRVRAVRSAEILRRWRRSGGVCYRPLLTVRERQLPMLRARGGHGRRGQQWLRRGGDGYTLNRRVRPVLGDHEPRWLVSLARGVSRPCGVHNATGWMLVRLPLVVDTSGETHVLSG